MTNFTDLRRRASILRLLGLLTADGLSLEEALELAADHFTEFRNQFVTIKNNLNRGVETSFEMIDGFFPPFIPRFLSAGAGYDMSNILFHASHLLDCNAEVLKKHGAPVQETHEIINGINFFRMLSILLSMEHPLEFAVTKAGKACLLEFEISDTCLRLKEMPLSRALGFYQKFRSTSLGLIEIGEKTNTLGERLYLISLIKERLVRRVTTHMLEDTAPDQTKIAFALAFEHIAALYAEGELYLNGVRWVAKKSASEAIRTAFTNIDSQLRENKTLSEAMALQPELFPKFVIRILQRSDDQGNCRQRLESLAEYFKWDYLGIVPTRFSISPAESAAIEAGLVTAH